MRKINKLIVHCSATPEGRDVKTETIKDWHVNGNHWKDIGYHYVIELDGSIHKGRDENVIGAHCSGQNANSIGICYVGGVAKMVKHRKIRALMLKSNLCSNCSKNLKQNIQMRPYTDTENLLQRHAPALMLSTSIKTSEAHKNHSRNNFLYTRMVFILNMNNSK